LKRECVDVERMDKRKRRALISRHNSGNDAHKRKGDGWIRLARSSFRIFKKVRPVKVKVKTVEKEAMRQEKMRKLKQKAGKKQSNMWGKLWATCILLCK
jgi:hypothetical protein